MTEGKKNIPDWRKRTPRCVSWQTGPPKREETIGWLHLGPDVNAAVQIGAWVLTADVSSRSFFSWRNADGQADRRVLEQFTATCPLGLPAPPPPGAPLDWLFLGLFLGLRVFGPQWRCQVQDCQSGGPSIVLAVCPVRHGPENPLPVWRWGSPGLGGHLATQTGCLARAPRRGCAIVLPRAAWARALPPSSDRRCSWAGQWQA